MISHRKRSVWCFLFVTLFNLQGTRLIGGAIYCTTELRVCQELFWSFWGKTRSSQEQQLFKFTTLRSDCQEPFSEVFELGFRSISGNLCRLPHLVATVKRFFHPALRRSAYRADSFVRIPNLSPFVNALFHFSSFFLICTITSPYFSPTSVQFEKDKKIWLVALRQKEAMPYY